MNTNFLRRPQALTLAATLLLAGSVEAASADKGRFEGRKTTRSTMSAQPGKMHVTARRHLWQDRVNTKLREKMDQTPSEQPIRAIVTYRSLSQMRDAMPTAAVGSNTLAGPMHIMQQPKVTERTFQRLPLRVVEMTGSELKALALDPTVKHVSLDVPVRSASVAGYETTGDPSRKADAPSSLKSLTGYGVRVAVVDTGAHMDAADRPTYLHNYGLRTYYGDKNLWSESPFDGNGHGTHISATIAGNAGGSYEGIAPDAEIFSLRSLGDDGSAPLSDVLFTLDRLLARHAYHNIRVINLSLSKSVDEAAHLDPLVLAVEALWDDGVVVVCSAGNLGNHGYFSIGSPGNSSKVITVGSLRDNGNPSRNDDRLSDFSSMGPTAYDGFVKPDLLAPGEAVVASKSMSMKAWNSSQQVGSDNYKMSGTSMSTAMVTGAVALMLEQDPSLTPDTIKARLMRTAYPLKDGLPFEVGAGGLDITAALLDTTVAADASSPRIGANDANTGIMLEDISSTWGSGWTVDMVYKDSNLWKGGFTSTLGVDMNVWKGITTDGNVWKGFPIAADDWNKVAADANMWKGLNSDVQINGNVWKTRNATPFATPGMNSVFSNSADFAPIGPVVETPVPPVAGGEM